MKFLILEPFYGGSHRAFTDGLRAWSRHSFELSGMPARYWKWRMRGAALHFARAIKNPQQYAGVVVSSLMSLADLKALWGAPCPPAMLYFHENQFSYPLGPGEERDFQYGFTDITSALVADRILFNSHTHHRAFFAALPGFLRMMPEFIPTWAIDTIRAKSEVAYPGCQFDGSSARVPFESEGKTQPPVIIWNHRWEFDKNPVDFFRAIEAIEAMGQPFELVLLGERYRRVPEVFDWALERFKKQIIHCGYEQDKRRYRKWLQKGSLVISTAQQENFGMAVVEAVRFGCLPLLPNRLVYPEIIPTEFHARVLYSDQDDLVEKLLQGLQSSSREDTLRHRLSKAMSPFAWERSIGGYDDKLEELAALKR